MAPDFQQRDGQKLVSIASIEPQRVFCDAHIHRGMVQVPSDFHVLPDFRPVSRNAAEDARSGIAPLSAGADGFDPRLGPFSQPRIAVSTWAQSLDFLRDISTVSLDNSKLSPMWITGWLNHLAQHREKSAPLIPTAQSISMKANRLLWRSRRVLNCLAHVLPIIDTFESEIASRFWQVLLSDIAKLAAPTDTFWASIKEGLDPLSPRTSWSRAVAICGVEAAFPGLLRAVLIDKALDNIRSLVQTDGLMREGSIIGTVSAAADLSMMTRLPAIEPILQSLRLALASLRRADNSLVTFGAGASEYGQLLTAVLGPETWRPTTVFSGSGIARATAGRTTVWLRACQPNGNWGALCEIEAGGSALLTNFSTIKSGLNLAVEAQATHTRIKRRDEPEMLILDASAELKLSSETFTVQRQIRIAQSGNVVEGEDSFSSTAHAQHIGVKQLCFALAETCVCHASKDGRSVLIVTSGQQAWRFRSEGMDIRIEIGSGPSGSHASLPLRQFLVCRSLSAQHGIEFRARWQLSLEDAG